MQGRKAKSANNKTRWEKRRIARRFARAGQRDKAGKPKKPLAEPLKIASLAERKKALAEGNMLFYDGKKKVTVPLVKNLEIFSGSENGSLQGVYKRHDGTLVTLRAFPKKNEWEASSIGFFKLVGKNEKPYKNNFGQYSFALRQPDLGHVLVMDPVRGESFGLKALSRTEREQRAIGKGRHSFWVLKKFRSIFERLHYKSTVGDNLISKGGKIRPEYDMGKWHAIEAIDPKTGKARIFTFKIEENSK